MNNDYISRQDAVHTIMGQPPDAHYPSWYAAQIEAISAADVVPVVHGKWIENTVPDSMLKMCSDCGFTCGAYSFNYCPNCGAKMDGERKE